MCEDGRYSEEALAPYFIPTFNVLCLGEYVRSYKVDFCMSLATTLVHDCGKAGFQENARMSATTIVGI